MFKFILTGCDSSVHTRGAVALARVLLDADGELELACVYPHGGSLDRAGQYAGVLEDDANVTLADVVAHVPAGIEVRTRALPGTSPARALTEEAEATGADLVVLGSTHHGPVGRIVLGSTAQRMLHGAPCAVAVAP
jgi:nucleotide-binding universal stress UspA family protein